MSAGSVTSSPQAPSGEPEEPRLSRREQVRRLTTEEIKASAREQLTLQSAGQLSLRAVAREVGLAPSAIYRYFSSQQALVAAVAADAYASAALALRAARDSVTTDSTWDRCRAMGIAYREWALENRAEFNLIFTTDQAFLLSGSEVDMAAALHEFYAAPLQTFFDAARSGELDPSRARFDGQLQLSEALQQVRQALVADAVEPLDSGPVGLLLMVWTALHGYVSLEITGQLGWFFTNLDECYVAHLETVLEAAGFLRPTPD
ncbi:TetR/AcrR family transcriptional regulator [Nocardioides pacificus]